MSHPVLDSASAALGVALETRGDLSLLDRARRCLLISRAEKSPQPDTPWVRATVEAVHELLARNEILVTGTGRTAYDAALWSCAERGGSAVVAFERAPNSLPDIAPAKTLFVWPRQTPKDSAEAQLLRDRLMSELSVRAFAIHVRKTGNMAALAERMKLRGAPVEPFKAKDSPAPAESISIEQPKLTSTRFALPDETDWTYLTHFTREPSGAWPGESQSDYLRWLCSGSPFAPRDSFASLFRILKEKRIRACGRLMPGGVPMVCFTELHPRQTVPLRRWRSGLLRWSFTQYGLALRKEVLLQHAARAVIYSDRKTIEATSPAAQCFMQVKSSGQHDWTIEEEWRIAGDLILVEIPQESMLALVSNVFEAEIVRSNFGVQAAVID
jgi:hypothetical protein